MSSADGSEIGIGKRSRCRAPEAKGGLKVSFSLSANGWHSFAIRPNPEGSRVTIVRKSAPNCSKHFPESEAPVTKHRQASKLSDASSCVIVVGPVVGLVSVVVAESDSDLSPDAKLAAEESPIVLPPSLASEHPCPCAVTCPQDPAAETPASGVDPRSLPVGGPSAAAAQVPSAA